LRREAGFFELPSHQWRRCIELAQARCMAAR
jgi:hypothetical protein